MNRTIKFKAWHERLKTMYTVYSIDFDSGLVFCESEGEDTRHTFGMIDVELLQFTGIEDSNGEIYDGDIVAFFDMDAYAVSQDESGEWIMKGFPDSLNDRKTDILVIGNIYQHKELLG